MEELNNNGSAFDAPADNVAEGAAQGNEGEAAGGGKTPSPAPAADPRLDAIQKRIDDMDKKLFESSQREAYWRGQASRPQPETKVVEEKEPEPFKPNLEEFRAAYESDPAKAFADMAAQIAKTTEDRVAFKAKKETGTALAGNQQQQRIAQALQTEGQEIAREYSDLIGKNEKGEPLNPEFDGEAFDYAQKLAEEAGNPTITQGPWAGRRALSPGMMRAAADAVFGKWAKANKLPAKPAAEAAGRPRTLREIIESPPNSDSLGNRNGGTNRSGALKTIDDLLRSGFYRSKSEADDARAIMRGMEVPEERWVANVVEGMRNGEIEE